MRPVELIGDDVAQILQNLRAEHRGREPLRRRAEMSPDRIADVDDPSLTAAPAQLLLQRNPARLVDAIDAVAVRVHLGVPSHRSSSWVDFPLEVVAIPAAPYRTTKRFSWTVPVTVEIDGRKQLVIDIVEGLAEVIYAWNVADPWPTLCVGDGKVDVLARREFKSLSPLLFDLI